MNKMERDKVKNNYWLRITQLLWFVPLCYHLCLLPLNPLDVQGTIEMVYMTIVGVLSVCFFENKIGKITACICVGVWLSLLLVLGYGYLQGEDVLLFAYMIPSYRIFVLIAFIMMLLVPLFLIFHPKVMTYRVKAWSIIFTIMTLSGSVYCSIWAYEMQDRLASEKYRTCTELVAQIEDYKSKHGRYPSELTEVGAKGSFIYELSQDGRKYVITDVFEHWHDRCYVDYCTFSVESITYDSETRKWKHDRP